MVLEVAAANYIYSHFTNKEKFENNKYGGNRNNADAAAGAAAAGFFFTFFLIIFLILLGIPATIAACYFSWTSNTVVEWGTGFKILFAFFAFLAPFNYLLSHLIHKYDLLTYIEKNNTTQIVANTVQ